MYRSDFDKRRDLPSVSPDELKLALRQLATGVTVVTAELDGERYGITVSSFTSISLVPPVVMVSINNESTLAETIVRSEHFAVHILSSEREDLSRRFSSSAPASVKYGDVSVEPGASGAPTFRDSLATIDCVLENTVVIGTHTVMFGRVVHTFAVEEPGSPLIYYNRAYRILSPSVRHGDSGQVERSE